MRHHHVLLALLPCLIGAGCTLTPAALGPTAGERQAARATLRLRLPDLFRGQRRLQAVTAPLSTVRVSLRDATGAEIVNQVIAPQGDVTLSDLPLRSGVLVTLEGLGLDGQPVPGAVQRTVGALRDGTNTLPLSPEADTAGAIVAELLAADQAAGGTPVTPSVDFEGLIAQVVTWQGALRAPEASLLSPAAIATAWHAARAVPTATAAFYPTPGRLVLRPANWPKGATALASLSTPNSWRTVVYDAPMAVEAVPPGTWTLTVVPTEPGLTPTAYTIAVPEGGTVDQIINLGAPEAAPGLPRGRGGSFFGVVETGPGSSALLIAGGILAEDPTTTLVPPAPATSALFVPAADAPATPVAALPTGLAFAASAVHDGKLYWFGGQDASAVPTGDAGCLDPGTGTSSARASMPGGDGRLGATAATLGDRIYVLGGVDLSGSATSSVLAYDPVADTWATNAVPPLPEPLMFASAVGLNGTLYVLGGGSLDVNLVPTGTTKTFAIAPGGSEGWRLLPGPITPRLGAGAAVLDGKIFLVGGAINRAMPPPFPVDARLSTAVEVFDPASEAWTRRPALAQGRSLPAVGRVGNRLVVAGGLLGTFLDPGLGLPVPTVEYLAP